MVFHPLFWIFFWPKNHIQFNFKKYGIWDPCFLKLWVGILKSKIGFVTNKFGPVAQRPSKMITFCHVFKDADNCSNLTA